MNQEQFAELVMQSQSGDNHALLQLLLQAHTPVSFLTKKILQNPAAANQVTREVLEAVAENLSSLQDPFQFEQWLCRMTAARCVHSSPLLHRNFAEADVPAAWEDHMADRTDLSAGETSDAIVHMVDCLPESQRLCILLLSCGELTVPAIAQLTGFSEAIIKQNIKQGQNAIQQHLWELDSRGIHFAGVSSLTGILHDAMYQEAHEAAAAEMAYDILGIKPPVSLSGWVCRVLTVVVILLLVAILALGGLIALRMVKSML